MMEMEKVEVMPITKRNDSGNVCVKWHVWGTCHQKIAENQTCQVSLRCKHAVFDQKIGLRASLFIRLGPIKKRSLHVTAQ